VSGLIILGDLLDGEEEMRRILLVVVVTHFWVPTKYIYIYIYIAKGG
jgi:hypothetical protein